MINLIIPPISDCFMPTLGVAQIAGYLKNNKVNCRVFDAGAELLYKLYKLSDLYIEGQPYTYKNVSICLKLFSDMNNDINITLDNFQTDFNWRDLESTWKYVEQEEILSSILKKMSFICEESSEFEEEVYYGFSISYESQVILAMLMAKIIKKQKPKAKICLGGSLLYNYENVFYKIFYVSNLIDVLIVGAGEEVFRCIGLGKIYELRKLHGINFRELSGRYIIDMRDVKFKPIVYEPDFSNIHFEYYPSHQKAFPYMINDRCYYGKCHFCNGDRVEKQNIVKDVATAVEYIENIAEQTGIYNVYIVDAALSPRDFEVIAALTRKTKIRWIANARFEKKLNDENLISRISQKGCVMLRFGLESASQKILNLMNKGTNISVAEEILNLTFRNGIENHIYLMFGYPGETKEDRNLTLDFIKRNKKVISSYSVSLFQPIPETKIYGNLLSKIGERENAYEHMIELIYKDEEYYHEIYQDISKLNDILCGYAKTNVEYYSANIFNRSVEEVRAKAKQMITYKTNYLETKEDVEKEISIQFSPENELW